MKRILLFFMLVMAGALSSQAYDYPYLIFQTIDGNLQPMAVESLVLTVSDGELVMTNDTGTQRFALSQLSKMYFSETLTKIEDLKHDDKDNDGCEAVYDLCGRRVSNSSSFQGTQLPKGIYIVKKHGIIHKFAVK